MWFVNNWYVANIDNIKGKITERGFPTIMVGYTKKTATGIYQLYNNATKRVVLTHDIKWH